MWDVEIYDTTLRDGAQREGIAFSVEDKLKITQRLDAFGIHYIEGGWPGSNPKDEAYFQRAKKLSLKNAKIVAFGMTCRAGTQPQDDANIMALLDADCEYVAIVGKSWIRHVTEVLRTTPEENLRMIQQTIAFLRQHGRQVFFDAEHFFDGYRADPIYAMSTLHAALQGGAQTLVLCDTNGGALPHEIEKATREVRKALPADITLGIHAHNDGDMAVANSLIAVQAGCRHVQGTINGYGERCGNANLCSIIPTLALKLHKRILPEGSLRHLVELARYVAELANLSLDNHMPYVGLSAFAHKGGIHAAAVRRDSSSYQHIDPALVGNGTRVLISEQAGRSSILTKAEEAGLLCSTGFCTRQRRLYCWDAPGRSKPGEWLGPGRPPTGG